MRLPLVRAVNPRLSNDRNWVTQLPIQTLWVHVSQCFVVNQMIGQEAFMNQTVKNATNASPAHARSQVTRGLVTGWRGVRYQVEDVSRSIDFYTQHLGFN